MTHKYTNQKPHMQANYFLKDILLKYNHIFSSSKKNSEQNVVVFKQQ